MSSAQPNAAAALQLRAVFSTVWKEAEILLQRTAEQLRSKISLCVVVLEGFILS